MTQNLLNRTFAQPNFTICANQMHIVLSRNIIEKNKCDSRESNPGQRLGKPP